MDTKKLLLGTLAGTITSFITGFLVFGLALNSFMTSNVSIKDPPEYHWLIIGHIFFAFLVTYIFMKWAGISTLAGGLKAATLIGLLASLGYNFTFLGTTGVFPGGISAAIVDAIGSTLIWAGGGAGVGWILGKLN